MCPVILGNFKVYGYKEALHKLYRCRGYTKARKALLTMIDQMASSKIKG
jgi:hypothetical protein